MSVWGSSQLLCHSRQLNWLLTPVNIETCIEACRSKVNLVGRHEGAGQTPLAEARDAERDERDCGEQKVDAGDDEDGHSQARKQRRCRLFVEQDINSFDLRQKEKN